MFPAMATQSVILGASNCTRLVFENPNVHNISVSGTTLDQVQKLLDKTDSQVDSENVDSVVLSLGTNDVTQHRNDTEQIIVNVTTCVENVKHKYPNASIGVCSILPRRGIGTHIQALNSVASSVNTFIKNIVFEKQ
jgi:lysophospholipase L1-like esterase